jgi:hypothetical protein
MIRVTSLIIIFIAVSCGKDSTNKNSHSSPTLLKSFDMDQAFFKAIEKHEYRSYYDALYRLDSNITLLLFQNCYQIHASNDTAFTNQMNRRFPNAWQPDGRELQADIQHVIQRKKIQTELTDAFKKLKTFLPSKPIPSQILFLYSDFGIFCFSTEKTVSIGLENFLGDASQVVKKINLYPWLKKKMKPEFLCPRAIHNWLNAHYLPEGNENIASEMIRWGKLLYITSQVLPETRIGHILAQNDEDMVWLVLNEKIIWNYILDQKLLYDTQEETTRDLLADAPFSLGKMGVPDRTGQFIGYQMVREFMQKNSITLPELLNTHYLKIVQQYSPPK